MQQNTEQDTRCYMVISNSPGFRGGGGGVEGLHMHRQCIPGPFLIEGGARDKTN